MEPKPLTAFQQSYHWRNKNCGPWAQEWVKKTLPGVKVEDGAVSAEITEVTSVEGDCDLGQRKGKLLTIYDLAVQAKWKGTSSLGSEVTGRLSIPEFSHEAIDGLSDYVFTFSVDSGEGADEVLAFARKAMVPELTRVLNGFRAELLDAHGIFEGATPAQSGASTPNLASYSPAPPGEVRAKPAAPAKKEDKVTRTTTVEVSASLQASADDLWSLLTDENRVPMWSRAAAKISPTPGTDYALFAGNVTGKIEQAEKPTKLVQTWQTKSPGWPSDHYGTMTITLDQGSDSTKLTFALDGVPQGKEADIERALESFYILGLKQMGLVLSHSSRTYTRPSGAAQLAAVRAAGEQLGGSGRGGSGARGTRTKPRGARKRQHKAGAAGPTLAERVTSPQFVAGTAAVALAAVFVGLVANSFKSSP